MPPCTCSGHHTVDTSARQNVPTWNRVKSSFFTFCISLLHYYVILYIPDLSRPKIIVLKHIVFHFDFERIPFTVDNVQHTCKQCVQIMTTLSMHTIVTLHHCFTGCQSCEVYQSQKSQHLLRAIQVELVFHLSLTCKNWIMRLSTFAPYGVNTMDLKNY